jgi:hypothetical protein
VKKEEEPAATSDTAPAAEKPAPAGGAAPKEAEKTGEASGEDEAQTSSDQDTPAKSAAKQPKSSD